MISNMIIATMTEIYLPPVCVMIYDAEFKLVTNEYLHLTDSYAYDVIINFICQDVSRDCVRTCV